MGLRNEIPDDRLWTIEDAAAYLRVHVNTVRRYVKEEGLPHERIGRAYRFRREDVDQWLEGAAA